MEEYCGNQKFFCGTETTNMTDSQFEKFVSNFQTSFMNRGYFKTRESKIHVKQMIKELINKTGSAHMQANNIKLAYYASLNRPRAKRTYFPNKHYTVHKCALKHKCEPKHKCAPKHKISGCKTVIVWCNETFDNLVFDDNEFCKLPTRDALSNVNYDYLDTITDFKLEQILSELTTEAIQCQM